MTIERSMFPPRRDNPFRLVGGFESDGSEKPARIRDDEPEVPSLRMRPRDRVRADIDAHVAARKAYQQAVSWLAATEAENLPAVNIEAAREDIRKLHAEMVEAARTLLIVTPTDLKALIDLMMYLEKNFTSLPAEVVISGEYGGCQRTESLAFHLLRTVRLSLRAVAKYGKHGRDDE